MKKRSPKGNKEALKVRKEEEDNVVNLKDFKENLAVKPEGSDTPPHNWLKEFTDGTVFCTRPMFNKQMSQDDGSWELGEFKVLDNSPKITTLLELQTPTAALFLRVDSIRFSKTMELVEVIREGGIVQDTPLVDEETVFIEDDEPDDEGPTAA